MSECCLTTKPVSVTQPSMKTSMGRSSGLRGVINLPSVC